MIVCVCKNISDHAIRRAVSAGHDSFEDIQVELGAAVCCGKCEHAVRATLCSTGSVASATQLMHFYAPPNATKHAASPFARALRMHSAPRAHGFASAAVSA